MTNIPIHNTLAVLLSSSVLNMCNVLVDVLELFQLCLLQMNLPLVPLQVPQINPQQVGITQSFTVLFV